MRPLIRRKLDVVLMAVATVAVAVVAVIGSAVGDSERVADLWVDAELSADGALTVNEAIDYDFGLLERRGIFRDVEDLDPDADIGVASPSAPDEFVTFDRGYGSRVETRIRIGDPDVTISGRHRYEISFPLADLAPDDVLAWDAVGTDWAVPIEEIDIQLRSHRELMNVECLAGDAGSWDPCTAEPVAPGALRVHVDRITPGQGVTLYANLGAPVTLAPPGDFLPGGEADDPGLATAAIAVIAVVTALVVAIPTSRWIKLRGRERVHAGGAVAATFGGSLVGVDSVDHRDLAAMASIAYEPPKGIGPADGGVIFRESVQRSTLPAWLLQRAIDGEIDLDVDDKDVTLRRGSAAADPRWAPTLNKMFGGRESIDLSKHDKKFTSGWRKLETTMQEWQKTSPFWDDEGRVQQVRIRAFGVLVGLVGLAVVFAGGAGSARWGGPWLLAIIVGAALAGAGVVSLLRSWELLVRSPEGSSAWIQIESFRRFLEGSEAEHVERAASMGRLREYTAWAIALNETSAWTRSVEAAVDASPQLATSFASDLLIIRSAHHISSASARGSTPPRSSGSGGGGFSGGVGGGGGGGGGGSW